MKINNTFWRFEKKIIIRKECLYSFISLIKKNNFFLNEKYPKRNVKNLYLDTYSYTSFFQNLEGLSDREKFRVRWYDKKFDEKIKGNFECKIKRNKINSKKIFQLKPFKISLEDNSYKIYEKIKLACSDKEYKRLITTLRPSLFTEYRRSYYSSPCDQFRITLDNDVIFRKTSNLLIKNEIKNKVIVEIKYPSHAEKDFKNFIKDIPYRFSRMSKYVNAVSQLSII